MRLVDCEAFRTHRRGQALIAKLAQLFTDRAADHLRDGRGQLALADCHHAAHLAGNSPAIAKVQQAAQELLAQAHRQRQHAAAIREQARAFADSGRLSTVEALLQSRGGTPRHDADELLDTVRARRQLVEPIIEQVARALKRGELHDAIRQLVEAKRWVAGGAKLQALTDDTVAAATERIRSWIDRGHLDLAEQLLAEVETLEPRTMELVALRRILAHCRDAAEQLEAGQFHRCALMVERAQAVAPRLKWLSGAAVHLKRAADEIDRLRAGPLGCVRCDLDQVESRPRGRRSGRRGGPRKKIRHKGTPMSPNQTPRPNRFVLSVNGSGSFLVFCDPTVSVGPISSSQRPMVGLITDPSAPVVRIERSDGDYFLTSDRPVVVNDQPTSHHLLSARDKIALSGRCRITFVRPNAASDTAKLTFSGGRLPSADMRGVVLMGREMVLGPSGAAHVPVREMGKDMTLLARPGGIQLPDGTAAEVRGTPLSPGDALPFGEPVQLEGLTMTLNRCE
jgi:hypothetical protein